MNFLNHKFVGVLLSFLLLFFVSTELFSEEKVYFEAQLNGEKCGISFPFSSEGLRCHCWYRIWDCTQSKKGDVRAYSLGIIEPLAPNDLECLEEIKSWDCLFVERSRRELVDTFYGTCGEFRVLDILSRDKKYFYHTRYIPAFSKLYSISASYRKKSMSIPTIFEDEQCAVMLDEEQFDLLHCDEGYVKVCAGDCPISLLLDHSDSYDLCYEVKLGEVSYKVSISDYDESQSAEEILLDWLEKNQSPLDLSRKVKFHTWNGFQAIDLWRGEFTGDLTLSFNSYRAFVSEKHFYLIMILNAGKEKIDDEMIFEAFRVGDL